MALIKCKECGSEISSTAKACPHCGHKPSKAIGGAGTLFIILAGLVFFVAIFGSENGSRGNSRPAVDAKKEAAFQKVVASMKVVLSSSRNPDSVKWETVRANDDASIICLQFRGQNGFGGMSKEFVVWVKDSASQKTESWNKHCTKPLNDMIYARQAL